MHDDRLTADRYALWAGVQVDIFIQINAMRQMDMIGEAQANVLLNRGPSFHLKN